MKKLQTLLTVAILSWMGASTGTAQAGNYRPTNPGTVPSNSADQRQIGPVELKATTATATGIKTANWFDGCYTVPFCNGGYCAPVTRCNAPCSPYGTRPYFPATGMGYGGYGGYGYGGYGVGYPNYGGVIGGYGGYSTPIYTAPINQGVGYYGSPVMTSPVVAPTMSPVITPTFGNGIVAPVNGVYPSSINGGFTQPTITQPTFTQPLLTNPTYNSPFYP